MQEVYGDTYYRTWYSIDQYHGFHAEFAQIEPRTIEQLIKYPFNGSQLLIQTLEAERPPAVSAHGIAYNYDGPRSIPAEAGRRVRQEDAVKEGGCVPAPAHGELIPDE